jgi:hypothetical protein
MANKTARRAGSVRVSVKAKPKTKHRTPTFDKAVVLGWNKKSTLRQNYTNMGVVNDVNRQVLIEAPEGEASAPAPIELVVPVAKERFYPMSEMLMAELRPLIRKHGSNLSKMARDRKLNAWQKTVEQLAKDVAHFNATEEHAAAKQRANSA